MDHIVGSRSKAFASICFETVKKSDIIAGMKEAVETATREVDWGYSPETLRRDLRFLRDQYGLRIRMGRKTIFDDVFSIDSIEKMNLREAAFHVGELTKEIAKYPPNLIRTSEVKTIRFADFKARRFSRGTGGFYNQEEKIIYLLSFSFESFHHEIFHAFDTELEDPSNSYENWVNIFPSFLYLGDELSCNVLELRKLRRKGFAGTWGRKNPLEDRATAAEELMTMSRFYDPKKDKILTQKIKLIKEFFEVVSDGLMGKQYFRDLRGKRVGVDYWQQRKLK
ncbi:MAG: hypothetical protein A2152_02630 [Candidatus Levybacteria bacterium RBG_16_35_6]|nr:MAG: hypothetical protein A2152_02630 [Candidatus Levybacteria bacterium RBG_16_35_6]